MRFQNGCRLRNSGYFLLSLVVQRVSGKPLRDFAQERIFTPLGMTDIQYVNDHAAIILHRATGYRPLPEKGFGVEMSNWEQNGDGGVNTTVEDLAKWDRNFYDPKVGGPWLIEQLQTPGTLNGGEAIEYARGLVVSSYRGLRNISHGGSWAGYRAELTRFPDQKFSVIALCNLATANPSALAQQVVDLYLADRLAPVPVEATAPVAAAAPMDPARYTGFYWSPAAGIVRRIIARDGKVFYVRSTNESELRFLGHDKFVMLDAPGTELSFPPAAAGAPRRMQLVTGTARPLIFEEEQPPAALQPGDLAAYSGTYSSAELDTVWILKAEEGKIVLHPKRGEVMALEPAFADAFNGPAGVIHFQRNAAKKITGFTVGLGRARDLQFKKVAGAS